MTWVDDSGEECCLNGICSECGGKSKKWTREEIEAAKDDIGMIDNDDFCDCCDNCMEKYMYVPEPVFSESSFAKEFLTMLLNNKNKMTH